LYSFYFFRQSKISLPNYLYFQSSARRPQADDEKWCSRVNAFFVKAAPDADFRRIEVRIGSEAASRTVSSIVKIPHLPRQSQLPHDDLKRFVALQCPETRRLTEGSGIECAEVSRPDSDGTAIDQLL
jgi:hypothetical protein